MSLKVGITGGIGSGKSLICEIFRQLQVPVFHADEEARRLMNSHPNIKEKLIHLYGKGIYSKQGGIDRKKLAGIIFNDSFELQKVNEIVHPVVREYFFSWAEAQNSPYIVHEAAILFESGFYKFMDYSILVSADLETRLKRVMDRDGVSRKEVMERVEKQWSDEKKRSLADIEIVNDGSEMILPKIIHIDKALKKDGKIW